MEQYRLTSAFVILITMGGFLPITTYGQTLNDSNPPLTPSANQGTFQDGGTNNTSAGIALCLGLIRYTGFMA